MAPDRTIHLTSDKGSFLVAIVPPHEGHPPKLFEDHRTARGWAGGVRLVTGWKLIDQVAEADHG